MSWVESHGFSTFGEYNLDELEIDRAWLNVTNYSKEKLWLYELAADCLECPYVNTLVTVEGRQEPLVLEPSRSAVLKVSTTFSRKFRFENDGSSGIIPEEDVGNRYCQVDTKMGEFGIYELTAREESVCKLETVLDPVSILLPFLPPIFFYLGLSLVIFLFKKYKHKLFNLFGISKSPGSDQNVSVPGTSVGSNNRPAVIAPAPVRQRLRSLDTFRGICITIMIFVNDGGAGYYFLEHATWDGLYIADLVFPWFLWIMGVCIPVSIKSQVKRNTPTLTILKRIGIRSFKLIAIGIILNTIGGPVLFSKLRIFGVLQRFGICYLVVATIVVLCCSDGFVNNRKANNKYIAAVQDIWFIWKGWVIVTAVVILHTCLTFLLRVPGCPTGYLGPGGLHKDNAYDGECIGGATGYIDRKILTMDHIYQWPTSIGTYRSAPFDPEGILGTLTSIFTVWLGVQTGLTLQVYPKHKSRLVRWAIWAVLTGAVGAALCGGKETGGVIPLNKNLWSLSFVFVLGSFALLLLIGLYVSIDMFKVWSGTPFFEPGMNSILLYVGHSIAGGMMPWHFTFNRMNTHFKRLVESLWGTSMWVLYSIYLYHKKFFWSL